jgi:ketosteroid isomerase-like protein
MDSENLAVVRRLYDLFPDLAAGEPPPEVIALFDPDVRLDQSRNVFNPAVYEGIDGLLGALAAVRETWDSFAMHPERFVEVGDNVVVFNVVTARGSAGGVEVEDRSSSVHRLRDGRIVALTIYPDPEEGLRAAAAATARHSGE